MNLLRNIDLNSEKKGQTCPDTDYSRSFYDLFSLYVGQGKRFSNKEIASATNFSLDTIKNWADGTSAPNFDNLIILCRIMPFEFKCRFINMLGGTDLKKEINNDLAEDLEGLIKKYRGEV